MRLLIITQKINKNDPILGFFHGWINEFSKHFDSIVGICLEKGEYDLPSNVKVLSLGKERFSENCKVKSEKSKVQSVKFLRQLKYVVRFWSYIWRERKNYDAVFVHMNQEYILLGGLFWRLMGKKTYMWRNHHAGTFLTDTAGFLCNKVFCPSRFSYTAKFKNAVLMPVGINTDLFKREENLQRGKHSILFLGRISPVKKPDLLIDVLVKLHNDGRDFTASFYGDSLPKDGIYHDSLIKKVLDAGLSEKIKFYPGIPNNETVDVYNKHEIFVNLSSSGMYDKTIFEAMACECLVLASNRNLIGLIKDRYIFHEGDFNDLKMKLVEIIGLDRKEKEYDRSVFIELAKKNSLLNLAKKLSEIIK